MYRIKTILFYSIILSLFLIQGCKSEKQKQEEIAQKIAEESCQQISEISSGIVGGIISGITGSLTDGQIDNVNSGSLGKLPDHWCDCYTYFVTKDLSENFSEKELMEIQNDNIKKLMVLERILETRKEEMSQCIMQSIAEKANDYDSFAKELDKKFKK